MDENSLKDYKQRGAGDEREAHVEIRPSGRTLRLAIRVNTTAADVKIWSELPCGIPSDVLSLEMENRKLADHEVILKTALATGEIPLKLTLSPWWLRFVSACMKGDGERVRARINIKMSGISQEDRIFVAAFTAAQRGDHSLLFSVIAGRKIDAERRVELSGRTLLHAAIFGGTISCMTNILVNGGNSLLETPDVTGESPIQLAHRLHGNGKILQLLNMYLELHRRESSRDIWSLIDDENREWGNSSTSSANDVRCKCPEDKQEWSDDEDHSKDVMTSCCKAKESYSTSHRTLDFEENITADSIQPLSEENETTRASTEDGRPERVNVEKQKNNSCQKVPQRTKADQQSEGTCQGVEKALESSREFDTPQLRKPKVPSLQERRKMSRQRRIAHAQARKSTDSTTNVPHGDSMDSLEYDSNKLAVDWQEKTSDNAIDKAHDATKQRRKGVVGFTAQLPLVRQKLERILHELPTFKLTSRDSSPGSSSSGDEFASVSDLCKGVRKPSDVAILSGSTQSDKSCLLPAISVNRNDNVSVSSDRQQSEKHVHSSACVKPPLPHTQAKKMLPLSAGSPTKMTRQRKQSQPVFGSPINLARGFSLARSRRRSLSSAPLLGTSPPAASGFERHAGRHGSSTGAQYSSPRGVLVRKAWWRNSEGSMSEGSADEDWYQTHNQSPSSRREQHPPTCQADQTESKDAEKARMFRSKSDPMRGNHHANYYGNKESKRKLSSKAFEQWLQKKDKEALNLEEKRIKAVERELKKLRHTEVVETDQTRVPANKGRVGSL